MNGIFLYQKGRVLPERGGGRVPGADHRAGGAARGGVLRAVAAHAVAPPPVAAAQPHGGRRLLRLLLAPVQGMLVNQPYIIWPSLWL